MSYDEFCSQLLSLGYEEFSKPLDDKGKRWFMWRHLDGFNCDCNNFPPILNVCAYEFIDNVSVEIIGERNGFWVEAKIYSLTRDDFIPRNRDIYGAMAGMWGGFCSSQIRLNFKS